MLYLKHGGHFNLEMWRFYESFATPLPRNNDSSEDKASDRPPSHQIAEVRCTLRGTCVVRQAQAVRLSGLEHEELNQTFARDAAQLVDSHPTWWSADGQYFIYFAQEYNHWKANAVRAAGGDGIYNVGVSQKKAGCGWAHTAVADAADPEAVLWSSDGWFEVSDDEWELATVKVHECTGFQMLDFHADEVVFEERHKCDDESSVDRLVDQAVVFHGWRQGSDDVRVVLPPVGEFNAEGDVQIVAAFANIQQGVQRATNLLGDPESIVLKRCARL